MRETRHLFPARDRAHTKPSAGAARSLVEGSAEVLVPASTRYARSIGYTGYMSGIRNDCLICHCNWEEKHALPYLPERWQKWMKEQHASLKARGWPARAVLLHSQEEMKVFRRYCPPKIISQIEDDHERFEPVLDAFALNNLKCPGACPLA